MPIPQPMTLQRKAQIFLLRHSKIQITIYHQCIKKIKIKLLTCIVLWASGPTRLLV